MSQREDKINKLLEFPHDAFLMIRLEYVQILGDELEAKLLRIIEKYVEQARKNIYQKMLNTVGTTPGETVEVTKDIWVPISYRLFMNDLFGTIKSENTLKRALADMESKQIIFHRYEPKKKYDAPEYKLNVVVLQELLNILKNPGYQNLIPSILDTLKNLYPQKLTPSGYQELLSSIVKSRSEEQSRVSNSDTNITEDYGNNSDSITEESASSHEDAASTENVTDLHQWKTDSGKMPAIPKGEHNNDPNHPQSTGDRVPEPLINRPAADVHHGEVSEERRQDARADSTRTVETGQERESQLDTSLSGSPGDDARLPVSHPPDSRRNHGAARASGIRRNSKPTQIEKPQLTFGGQQVKEWYEQAKECKVRMTDKNVIALNRLADIDEMTQDNLKDVIELYDKDKWVIEHNVTVDVQELEKPDGKFTFERGLLVVKRKRRGNGQPTSSNAPKRDPNETVSGLPRLPIREVKYG